MIERIETAASITLYHGTIPKYAEIIKKNGLQAGRKSVWSEDKYEGDRAKGIFATTLPGTALHWAILGHFWNKGKNGSKVLGLPVALVTFVTDEKPSKDTSPGIGSSSVILHNPVSPKNIKSIEVDTVLGFLRKGAELKGFDKWNLTILKRLAENKWNLDYVEKVAKIKRIRL